MDWPCFNNSHPTTPPSQQPPREAGHRRFSRLLEECRNTFISGEGEGGVRTVIDGLVAKCERYMQDVERLVRYGKIRDERFPCDLSDQLALFARVVERPGSWCGSEFASVGDVKPHFDGSDRRHGELTSLRVDELQREALKLANVKSDGGDDASGPNPSVERHWHVLCCVIATIISRVLERRAAIVGQRGVHALVCDLMRHARSNTRFHLLGHAHGAHAALSATLGASLPRRLHSVYIVQGSCDARIASLRFPYRPLARGWQPVAGPLICVATAQVPLLCSHPTLDDVGALAARGWEGVRDKRVVVRGDALPKVRFAPGVFYSVNARDLMLDGGVCANSQLVELLWDAATIRLSSAAYNIVDMAKLPSKYWTSYNSRTGPRFNTPSIRCGFQCLF